MRSEPALLGQGVILGGTVRHSAKLVGPRITQHRTVAEGADVESGRTFAGGGG